MEKLQCVPELEAPIARLQAELNKLMRMHAARSK
jgi:uncharacterized small protein (DUF1192 family)